MNQVSTKKLTQMTMAAILALAIIWVVFAPHSTQAATVGDPLPAARSGATCVLMDDGGTNVATPMWTVDGGTMMKANTFLVQNPSGSSGSIYCGFNAAVTSTNGVILTQGSSINVDITCASPLNTACPMLYCTTGSATVNQTSPNCARWMRVK